MRMRPLSALRGLLTSEAGSGLLLMAAAVLALLVANSPAAPAYQAGLGAYVGGLSVLHWINDALMALFFLLVGLEIKRELVDGHLSTWRRRALPGVAAIGGMAVPALCYLLIAGGDPALLRGWAIPTATDIAFALGVLALLGKRAPISLKIFLTALAILDDLGAVVIIALFYTAEVATGWLLAAALLVAVGAVLGRTRHAGLAAYAVLGVLLWAAVLKSGVHPTLAGVALAAVVPLRRSPGRPDDTESLLHRLEHRLQKPVAYGVLPIFAFANAGVALSGLGAALATPLPLAIVAGLALGKPLGVFGAAMLAIRLRLAVLPEGAGRAQLFGVSALCGIGFTMSLFIGLLAFPADPLLQREVKAGILLGSLLAGLTGVAVLLLARRGQTKSG